MLGEPNPGMPDDPGKRTCRRSQWNISTMRWSSAVVSGRESKGKSSSGKDVTSMTSRYSCTLLCKFPKSLGPLKNR